MGMYTVQNRILVLLPKELTRNDALQKSLQALHHFRVAALSRVQLIEKARTHFLWDFIIFFLSTFLLLLATPYVLQDLLL